MKVRVTFSVRDVEGGATLQELLAEWLLNMTDSLHEVEDPNAPGTLLGTFVIESEEMVEVEVAE